MKITPENGQAAYYATVEMADDPSEIGTPLNKSTLLKDATASLFGLGATALPDDVLKKISQEISSVKSNNAKFANGSYRGANDPSGKRLTFPFPPKIVLVQYFNIDDPKRGSGTVIASEGSQQSFRIHYSSGSTASTGLLPITMSGNSIFWPKGDFNDMDRVSSNYYYIAIGG